MKAKPAIIERDGHLVISIPMKFKRIGGRKEIIVPHGLGSPAAARVGIQRPLAIALARAHRWKDRLENGRFHSVIELADAMGLDRSYVARILRLTLLAPGIIEAIMNGNERDGMSLDQLVRAVPARWEEQRECFGM